MATLERTRLSEGVHAHKHSTRTPGFIRQRNILEGIHVKGQGHGIAVPQLLLFVVCVKEGLLLLLLSSLGGFVFCGLVWSQDAIPSCVGRGAFRQQLCLPNQQSFSFLRILQCFQKGRVAGGEKYENLQRCQNAGSTRFYSFGNSPGLGAPNQSHCSLEASRPGWRARQEQRGRMT